MYEWRKMNDEEQKETLALRRSFGYPWHSPPHQSAPDSRKYLLTAACYEHKTIIGTSRNRLLECSIQVLTSIKKYSEVLYAWCILPNHYHILVKTRFLTKMLAEIGLVHGRLSYKWNGEDKQRGRQIWHCCIERFIRSERHFWATVNYIHHNPVYHNVVTKWQDWPFSSAPDYLESIGREKAAAIWNKYPILDYGKKWDVYDIDHGGVKQSSHVRD